MKLLMRFQLQKLTEDFCSNMLQGYKWRDGQCSLFLKCFVNKVGLAVGELQKFPNKDYDE